MIDHEPYFKELFERYKVPLHDYVQSITASHEVAQDIVQEIFIRLWKKKEELHAIENMDGFIFRVARNEAMDYFNKVGVDNRLYAELKKRVVAVSNEPEQLLDAREVNALLEKAIAALSPQRQKAYRLSRQQFKSIEEIAAELNVSFSTAKNTLVSALAQVREYISKHFVSLVLLLQFLMTGKNT